jgi:hypothetical protein
MLRVAFEEIIQSNKKSYKKGDILLQKWSELRN